jgi:hypothetical protein
MVAMPVGQQDMPGAQSRLAPAVFGKDRVTGDPGVDQQGFARDLDAKARMAKPGDFHMCLPIWYRTSA